MTHVCKVGPELVLNPSRSPKPPVKSTGAGGLEPPTLCINKEKVRPIPRISAGCSGSPATGSHRNAPENVRQLVPNWPVRFAGSVSPSVSQKATR